MTVGDNTDPDYWEYGFEVFNVFCWGQKTDLQVRVSRIPYLTLSNR